MTPPFCLHCRSLCGLLLVGSRFPNLAFPRWRQRKLHADATVSIYPTSHPEAAKGNSLKDFGSGTLSKSESLRGFAALPKRASYLNFSFLERSALETHAHDYGAEERRGRGIQHSF